MFPACQAVVNRSRYDAEEHAVTQTSTVINAQAAFMHSNDLPVEVLDGAELEEAKADLIQVHNSLNQKEVAADIMRGATQDMFYKVESCLDPAFHGLYYLRDGITTLSTLFDI